jgi:lipoate-protein ligase A
LLRRDEPSNLAAAGEPFLCFQRQASGDVLLVAEGAQGDDALPGETAKPAGWKILGSAQRRHRGAVLQHGSLLLERSPAAPELPGLRDLTGVTVNAAQWADALSVRLAAALDVPLYGSQLPVTLELMTDELANTKYGRAGWTNRR